MTGRDQRTSAQRELMAAAQGVAEEVFAEQLAAGTARVRLRVDESGWAGVTVEPTDAVGEPIPARVTVDGDLGLVFVGLEVGAGGPEGERRLDEIELWCPDVAQYARQIASCLQAVRDGRVVSRTEVRVDGCLLGGRRPRRIEVLQMGELSKRNHSGRRVRPDERVEAPYRWPGWPATRQRG